MVLQYLESKSLFGAERALRAELALHAEESASGAGNIDSHNIFVSELERQLGLAGMEPSASTTRIHDLTPSNIAEATEPARLPNSRSSKAHVDEGTATALGGLTDEWHQQSPAQRVRLHRLRIFPSITDERALRKQFGAGTSQSRVIFHDPAPMNDVEVSQCESSEQPAADQVASFLT